jgi:hypothetical protein
MPGLQDKFEHGDSQIQNSSAWAIDNIAFLLLKQTNYFHMRDYVVYYEKHTKHIKILYWQHAWISEVEAKCCPL